MSKINWAKMIKPYQKPNRLKSYWQIINSFTLFIGFWLLAYQAYQISIWLTIPVALAAQLVFLRIFIILHDCGHGSFFRKKKERDFWGTICGIVTFTPYHQWASEHADHHKQSGDLDKRGRGDVWTLTLKEYQDASYAKRVFYKLYRFPVFMLTIGTLYNFVIMHRFTFSPDGDKERASVYITNLGILVMGGFISALSSWEFFLTYQFAMVFFGGAFGIGLFYVQHQFEGVYWNRSKDWDYETAAVYGSSYLKLPRILQWASGNIGFHHIHHLSPMIPNYELENCYNEQEYFHMPELTLTLADIGKCYSLHVYDEETQQLLTFKQADENLASESIIATAEAS